MWVGGEGKKGVKEIERAGVQTSTMLWRMIRLTVTAHPPAIWGLGWLYLGHTVRQKGNWRHFWSHGRWSFFYGIQESYALFEDTYVHNLLQIQYHLLRQQFLGSKGDQSGLIYKHLRIAYSRYLLAETATVSALQCKYFLPASTAAKSSQASRLLCRDITTNGRYYHHLPPITGSSLICLCLTDDPFIYIFFPYLLPPNLMSVLGTQSRADLIFYFINTKCRLQNSPLKVTPF